jgi:hypothetical protein
VRSLAAYSVALPAAAVIGVTLLEVQFRAPPVCLVRNGVGARRSLRETGANHREA